MTDTADVSPGETPGETPGDSGAPSGRRKAGLEGMLLPELKQLASTMGLRVSGMRKGQVLEAIRAAQGSGQGSGQGAAQRPSRGSDQAPAAASADASPDASRPTTPEPASSEQAAASSEPERSGESSQQTSDGGRGRERRPDPDQGDRQGGRREGQQDGRRDDQQDDRSDGRGRGQQDDEQGGRRRGQQDGRQDGRQGDKQDDRRDDQRGGRKDDQKDDQKDGRQDDQQDDEQGGSRRNRRRRGRDRNQGDQQGDQGGGQNGQPQRDTQRDNQRGQQGQRDNDRDNQRGQRNQVSRRGEPDLQILEDDVLAPCAGILDLLDNYAFVRTSGYLPGTDDVYVSMSMVRKHGLRRGDAVAGMVRQPREGERREKFNPLVRIDTVNGADPEIARNRVEFGKLTPLYPSERLRLETSGTELVGRTLDLLTPLGKGQRGLVLSPAKGGKTTVLQAIASAVTTNNPECHVMVVLVDERPEEVTDYQRSIKGEVISSTFDRPPADHTLVAELALERAKRLVELGHDVVVLLDGLTRLARAFNAAAPSSSRNLVGGLDPAALHQSKKFFGAARNVENGGSLSIVATASTGSSPTDAAILEEFEGTENMELWLRRELAEPAVFPAVDVLTSGTRHEELLLGEGELQAARALRRSLAGLERTEASVRLAEQLRGTGTNLELLRRTSDGRS